MYDREAIKLANRRLIPTSLSAFEDARLIPSDQLFLLFSATWTWKSDRSHWWFHLCGGSRLATVDELGAAHPAIQTLAEENQIEVHPAALRWGSLLAAYALEEPPFSRCLDGVSVDLEERSA